MLNFTHNSRQSGNPYQLEFEQEFQPIVITTGGTGKQHQMPEPTRSKKKLVKSHSNSQASKPIGRTQKTTQARRQPVEQNRPWNSQTVTKTVGIFDRNLKKDTLAAQQRQIRAESRIKQNEKHRVKEQSHRDTKLLSKQEEIHKKKIEILAKEQQKQILRLKQMIQMERLEKERNDMEYEAKKRKIQAERKQLMELEKQIQMQGPKSIKEVRQKIKYVEPVQDKVKLKQILDQQNPKNGLGHRTYQNFAQITQSQSIANQKNKIRQQQLQYLVDQREKNTRQYQKNTLGYTPTLIPLLSRASYKIISTHISSLVQLFIDDLLEEQVYLLQTIQLEAKAEQQKQKEKQILTDYVRKLENFVDQNQQIEDKLGKYSQMKFQEIYKPPTNFNSFERTQSFNYSPHLFHKLQLQLAPGDLEQIQHRVDRFKRYVSSFDQYKNVNLDMFKKVTEEIINQAIDKMAKQLDTGTGQFVNVVFRSEFQ